MIHNDCCIYGQFKGNRSYKVLLFSRKEYGVNYIDVNITLIYDIMKNIVNELCNESVMRHFV